MIRKLLARVGIYTNTGWQEGYDAGYLKGLDEGGDFGKRVAYNHILSKEISGVLSRYGQLQIKLLAKPKDEIQAALEQFTNDEIARFKMELQDR